MTGLFRMEELVALLNKYSKAYYTNDDPLVSDQEYDALYTELEQLEKESGIVLEDSPTKRVGDMVLTGFNKHTHLSRLWSLDKSKTTEELKDWEERNRKLLGESGYTKALTYVVTMKFDGLTICLTYENGKLINGATRGTGEVGEEILPQLLTISGIKKNIGLKGLCEIRGEAVMTQEAFDRYNETAATPLKNLRNGAAGALRNLDLGETRKRQLSAWFYDINYMEPNPYTTYLEELKDLIREDFTVHPFYRVCHSIEEVKNAIDEIEALRPNLNFDIDGAVVCIDDLEARNILGYTAKFPRYSIAYKFEALESTTKLLDVEWNVGRTGKITPTAILEPCDIGGITISRATLNNLQDIRRKGVYFGANVFLRRSNDVIPEITGVTGEKPLDAKDIDAPEFCPVCGTRLESDGQLLYCPNAIGCKPQMVKGLAHWAERDAMNIEGFSEKTAEQLFEVLGLKSVDELYTLTKEQLMTLDNFKDKKALNLLENIEKSKKCTLSSFLYGLGIGGIGKKTAIDLAVEFGTIEKVMQAEKEDLLQIPEIGDILAENIYTFFRDEKIIGEIRALLSHGVDPAPEGKPEIAEDKKTIFYGKSVVVTGTLENFTRSSIKDKLYELGAKPGESVSKSTDYVLVGDSPGSKLDKAKKLNDQGLGPKILNEKEFMEAICEQ